MEGSGGQLQPRAIVCYKATARQLAKVLGVPTPYFYADDDDLADWILAYERVSTATRKSILTDTG